MSLTDMKFPKIIKRNDISNLRYNLSEGRGKGKKLMHKKDTQDLMIKLKNYYNLAKDINSKKSKKIDEMKNEAEKNYNNLSVISSFPKIELPDERIIFKDIEKSNISKNGIEKVVEEIKELQEKKELLKSLLINASEYSKTLEYMKEDEKRKHLKIQIEANELESKLVFLERYKKIMDNNFNKNNNKKKNLKELLCKLNNDINLIGGMLKFQKEKNENLQNQISDKEEDIQLLMEHISNLKEENKEELYKYKKEMMEKIQNAKDKEEEKKEKEKKFCNIVYCLNIIQKFFLFPEKFNKNTLEESQEYKAFINDAYEIILDKDEKQGFLSPIHNSNKTFFNSIKSNEFKDIKNISKRDSSFNLMNKMFQKGNNNNLIFENNNFLRNKSILLPQGKFLRSSSVVDIKNSHFNSSFNSTNSHKRKTVGITLDELKGMLEGISLSEKEVMDYSSKLISKITFYMELLKDLKKKEINMEHRKQENIKKVRRIIEEDYENFEEMTKTNEKFKEFLEENEDYICRMKLKTQLSNKEIIKNMFTSKDEAEEIDNTSTKDSQCNNESIIINCESLFMEINNFLQNIIGTFEDILNEDKPSTLKDKDIESNSITTEKNESSEGDPKLQSFKLELNELKILKDNIKKPIWNNIKNLEIFMEKMIKYADDNKITNEIKLDKLLTNLYKDNEHKEINDTFASQLLSIDIPFKFNLILNLKDNEENIIERINSVLDLLKKNQQLLMKNTTNLSISGVDTSVNLKPSVIGDSSKDNKSTSLINQDKGRSLLSKKLENLKKLKAKRFKLKERNITFKNKRSSSCTNEEEDISTETNNYQSEITNKNLSIIGRSLREDNIIKKLYDPYTERSNGLSKYNMNIKKLHKLSVKNSKYDSLISKKANEIEEISKNIQIYENSKLKQGNLSERTYDFLIQYMKEHKKN